MAYPLHLESTPKDACSMILETIKDFQLSPLNVFHEFMILLHNHADFLKGRSPESTSE